MREFMTKVSDYINERRNDPEKNGSAVIFGILGIAVLVILILCLLLLWRRNENKKEVAMKADGMKIETHEQHLEPVLAEFSGEELKQEYLTNVEYLGEKVEDLLQSMMEVRQSLEDVMLKQDENIVLQKQVEEITGDINNLVVELQNTQNHLYDLTDMINIMDKETIPTIQKQINEIEEQMGKVNTDISAIYAKIDTLETTDVELKAKISEIEGNLRASAEKNMTEVNNQFQSIDVQIQEIEVKLQELASQILRYRYDEESNTLYLFPND